ncbi:MAG: cytochrome c maturation protein CcmE [Anaerolineae bacterium]|nr:cytochrome c maturation protein CcmE [Anaerolineae bacterium]
MAPFRFLIGGLVIVAAIAFLSIRSFQANATYYVTSDEMVQKVHAGQITPGKTIRLAGNIDKTSV